MTSHAPSQTTWNWNPESWRSLPGRQQPLYPNLQALETARDELSGYPPLVHPGETLLLKQLLAEAAAGRRLVLQAGDCAEMFNNCRPETIEKSVGLVFEAAHLLEHASERPVVRMGRIAGQYAKPRTHPHEERQGILLPAYRGDMVNDVEFSAEARTPDPARMLRAYQYAALTLNWCRASIAGSVGHTWPPTSRAPFTDRFFASHEALLLPYESALTHQDSQGLWWSASAHFLWIGERTRQLDGAHVEFLRGLQNPVGIKLGPQSVPEDVVALCRTLNPLNEPGRITLITRVGAAKVSRILPALVKEIAAAQVAVAWFCDPLHGNDLRLASGRKTRSCSDVEDELLSTLDVHRGLGTHLAGIHLEATAEDVEECTELASPWIHDFSPRNYRSACDPRLNRRQTLGLLQAFAENSSLPAARSRASCPCGTQY